MKISLAVFMVFNMYSCYAEGLSVGGAESSSAVCRAWVGALSGKWFSTEMFSKVGQCFV